MSPTMEDVSAASNGGCILGGAITTVVTLFFVLGLALGRCTAPDVTTEQRKTHAAVCELLDQVGADTDDGTANEFCP